MVVVAPKDICEALHTVEDLLLELSNVKTAEYVQEAPDVSQEGWVSAVEGNLQVLLDAHRDEGLLGEGLMRDLARRIQALRKELGYVPTDVLEAVHVGDLEKENIALLQPYLEAMAELVRAKKVQLHTNRKEASAEWHETQLDEKKVSIAIIK
jgi:isoleucyl-tRNA synthetase